MARYYDGILISISRDYLEDLLILREGQIISDERGELGFGYDPIFHLAEFDKTMAELTMDEKNRLSHQAIATKQLIAVIKEKLGVK